MIPFDLSLQSEAQEIFLPQARLPHQPMLTNLTPTQIPQHHGCIFASRIIPQLTAGVPETPNEGVTQRQTNKQKSICISSNNSVWAIFLSCSVPPPPFFFDSFCLLVWSRNVPLPAFIYKTQMNNVRLWRQHGKGMKSLLAFSSHMTERGEVQTAYLPGWWWWGGDDE